MGRFTRVATILDEAVGGPDASFASHGPFWRGLTRDEFIKLKVINRDLLVVGDGPASNLVKALKGEALFGEDLDDPPRRAMRDDPADANDADLIQLIDDDTNRPAHMPAATPV